MKRIMMKLIIDNEYEVMFHTKWHKAVYVGSYNCGELFRTEEGHIDVARFHRKITTKHSVDHNSVDLYINKLEQLWGEVK